MVKDRNWCVTQCLHAILADGWKCLPPEEKMELIRLAEEGDIVAMAEKEKQIFELQNKENPAILAKELVVIATRLAKAIALFEKDPRIKH